MTQRRSFPDKFRATMALETLRADKTVQEIATKHKIHPAQMMTWKRRTINGLTGVFSDNVRKAEDNGAKVKELHAKIGEAGGRKRFFVTRAEAMSSSECKAHDQSELHGSDPDQPMETTEEQRLCCINGLMGFTLWIQRDS
ncbi:transposase [Sulfitobacter sp.]|uniref:transposase n=1 Tax=Sulfitobacter sp. TaxID=1903071 RepID=UPI00300263CE